MNITVEIKAPDLVNAIQTLAHAISKNPGSATAITHESEPIQSTAQEQPVQTQNAQAVPSAAPTAVPTAAPTQQPAQQAPAQPVQQPTQQEQPQAVPTSAPSYTLDQLAVAATQLVDAGRREELVQLLASFGVQALTALPKEQYGAFATKLREMGAKI
jgi:cell division septation protein DedD